MKAVILSAGQGRRLLPFTATLPKCLLRIGGRSVLEWQLRALKAGGVDSVVIVTGFGARQVDAEVAAHCPPGLLVRTIYNEIYDRSDNLVSCLAARSAMTHDFLLLNGDTLIQSGIVSRLLAGPASPVSMAVARKPAYDEDDMKIQWHDGQVQRVGKDLPLADVDGEAIGLSLYRGDGPRLFLDALETIVREPDGQARWYLSAVSLLAGRGHVRGVAIDGLHFIEIDYPRDLTHARTFLPTWAEYVPGAEAALDVPMAALPAAVAAVDAPVAALPVAAALQSSRGATTLPSPHRRASRS